MSRSSVTDTGSGSVSSRSVRHAPSERTRAALNAVAAIHRPRVSSSRTDASSGARRRSLFHPALGLAGHCRGSGTDLVSAAEVALLHRLVLEGLEIVPQLVHEGLPCWDVELD